MKHYTEIRNALTSAIQRGRVDSLKELLTDNSFLQILSSHSGEFLREAYQHQKFHVAEFLLSYGVDFDIKLILYANIGGTNSADCISHLNNIKRYIPDEQFNSVLGLITAFYSQAESQYTFESCYNITQFMASVTYTGNSSNSIWNKIPSTFLASQVDNTIHDVLTFATISNIADQKLKIYAPYHGSYINSLQTSNDEIYFPVSDFTDEERGFFIHELAHYVFDGLFNNNAAPYPKNDTIAAKAYHQAVKASLINTVQVFNKHFHNVKHLIEDDNITIRDILTPLSENVPLHIFSYRDGNEAHNDRLAKVYLGNNGMSAQHKNYFLKHYLDNVVKEYNFTEDTVYYLSRISDYSLRGDEELDQEFIVRLPELEANGIDASLLKLLSPISEYWRLYISPRIDSFREELNITECDARIEEVVIGNNGEIRSLEDTLI